MLSTIVFLTGCTKKLTLVHKSLIINVEDIKYEETNIPFKTIFYRNV